jgi:hypothetical protein
MHENSSEIIDDVLRDMKYEFNRYESRIRNERVVWDVPALRARVMQSCFGSFVVTLCSQDFLAGNAIDAARIIVYWNRDLRDEGKLAVTGDAHD